jgi:hypothetical protein
LSSALAAPVEIAAAPESEALPLAAESSAQVQSPARFDNPLSLEDSL